jgi:hypothetical protein
MSADPVSMAMKDAEQKATFWFNIIKFIGWPGVILIALSYAGWVATSAIWPYAVKIADTHVTVVTGLLEQQKTQDSRMGESNIMMGKINDTQTRMNDNQIKMIDEITASQTMQGKLLIEIHKAVVKSVDKDKE